MSDVETLRKAATAAADRLMTQVAREVQVINRNEGHYLFDITAQQVSCVLHALADHTAIQSALQHRPDRDSPWPHVTSLGRWFHDVGSELEVRE